MVLSRWLWLALLTFAKLDPSYVAPGPIPQSGSQDKAPLQSRVDYQSVPEAASVADRTERRIVYKYKLQAAKIRLAVD